MELQKVEEALVGILMAGEPEHRQAEAEETASQVVAHFESQIRKMTDPTDMNRVGTPYEVACRLINMWVHKVDRRNNIEGVQ